MRVEWGYALAVVGLASKFDTRWLLYACDGGSVIIDRLRVCRFCEQGIVFDGLQWVQSLPTNKPQQCVHPASEQRIHLPNETIAMRQERIIAEIERKRIP